jgi:hypothetical protein
MQLRLPRPIWFAVPAVVLVVTSIGLRVVIPAYRQRSAVKEIMACTYRTQVRPFGPKWLRDVLGNDLMCAVDEVQSITFKPNLERLPGTHPLMSIPIEGGPLDGPIANDDTASALRSLPGLKRVSLYCTNVTDAGIEHVSQLGNLEDLTLSGTDVSDSGLMPLKRLKHLKQLRVKSTRVTDAGVAELQRVLPGLKVMR